MTVGTLPPPGTPERQAIFERLLDDTGFFCRFVLGMNTDRDASGNATSEIGQGGVRDFGPHQECIRFIDDDSNEHGILWAPRYSYKSSMVLGFILRRILRNPDISILLCMHTTAEAHKRCRVIRDILKNNPVIKELYGDLEGPTWGADSFVTSLRRDHTLMSPTLFVGSPQKGLAGGRPNLVIFDDIVAETDVGSEKKLERGCNFVENALALRARGTRYLMVATPWDEADAGHWAIDAGWKKCVHLDVGCEIVQNDEKQLDLQGTSRWPNLSIDHLRGLLRGGMQYEKFMSQFMLRVVRGFNAEFHRHQFHPVNWKSEHKDMSGFLLCDTAPSGNTDGDLNVLMYVGIDERQHLHVLDCEVGFWQMYEFCDRYLAMLQRWQHKLNHRMEVWEKGQTYFGYMQHMQVLAKQRNVRLTTHAARRNQTSISKETRISMLACRFQSRQVSVMDTMPRVWNAGTETRVLWDPEDEADPKTKAILPGGDFVQQFIRFPHHRRRDIPDTLALVDTLDERTQSRVCCWARPAGRGPSPETMRNEDQDERFRPTGSATRFFDRYAR